MTTELIIIQPTSFCNINCRYCYLPDRLNSKRMSKATLSRIFEELFASSFLSKSVTIVWHAGEPLVLPVHFYEEAFELAQKWNIHEVQVTYSFQTNATLITQEWCDFFKRHRIRVGVSLDGPHYIHDLQRVDRNGRGTYDRTIRGIELLQENHIEYTAIAVITQNSTHYPDDIWHFFQKMNPVRLAFNPEERLGVHLQSSWQEDDIDSYKAFFKRILTLSREKQSALRIREKETLLQHIKYGSLQTKGQANVPLAILSFDCDGNVSTFSPELLTMTHPTWGRFTFGNVFDNTLEEMFSSKEFEEINAQIQRGVEQCRRHCEYFLFCGGGSPSNKLSEHGTFDETETMTCRLRIKAPADAMLEQLEEMYDNRPPELASSQSHISPFF